MDRQGIKFNTRIMTRFKYFCLKTLVLYTQGSTAAAPKSGRTRESPEKLKSPRPGLVPNHVNQNVWGWEVGIKPIFCKDPRWFKHGQIWGLTRNMDFSAQCLFLKLLLSFLMGQSIPFLRRCSDKRWNTCLARRPSRCYSFLILMLISSFPKIMEYISFRHCWF